MRLLLLLLLLPLLLLDAAAAAVAAAAVPCVLVSTPETAAQPPSLPSYGLPLPDISSPPFPPPDPPFWTCLLLYITIHMFPVHLNLRWLLMWQYPGGLA